MNIVEAEKYFLDRAQELNEMCTDGSPWVFLCASAFLEVLAKMIEGGSEASKTGDCYKDFIRECMPNQYGTFDFSPSSISKEESASLPDLMWHVLRNGIVHSFSLFPDEYGIRKGIKLERTIALCHRKEAEENGLRHLSLYFGTGTSGAVLFVAEDFVADITSVVGEIFRRAKDDPALKKNIENWLRDHPPIMGGF